MKELLESLVLLPRRVKTLLFSCDNDHVHNTVKFSFLLKMRIEDQILKDMAYDFERANEADRELDLFNLFVRREEVVMSKMIHV